MNKFNLPTYSESADGILLTILENIELVILKEYQPYEGEYANELISRIEIENETIGVLDLNPILTFVPRWVVKELTGLKGDKLVILQDKFVLLERNDNFYSLGGGGGSEANMFTKEQVEDHFGFKIENPNIQWVIV